MGRALLWPYSSRDAVAGTQCALTSKNATHGVARCPLMLLRSQEQQQLDGSSGEPGIIVFRRARPLSLDELLVKTERRYRFQGLSAAALSFVGPGGIVTPEPETSFGMLYLTPLRRALARDLVQANASSSSAAAVAAAEEPGQGFIARYGGQAPAAAAAAAAGRAGSARIGQQLDEGLWNTSNWAWSFYVSEGGQRASRGTVDRAVWMRDRYAACSASYNSFAEGGGGGRGGAVKGVTLCEPAPTASLQALCKAMLQYRTDVTNINCQVRWVHIIMMLFLK